MCMESKIISTPCKHCGGKGLLRIGYDMEQVICINCGFRTPIFIGDYYDEGFMDGTYAIKD